MELGLSRRSKSLLLTIVLALLLLIAFAWQRIEFAVAVASSDARPSLLRDAEWGKPETATAFLQRFGHGSSETDLLRWLEANRFEIDHRAHRASLRLNGVPCAEKVVVSWTAIGGTIDSSIAVVSEAGCL